MPKHTRRNIAFVIFGIVIVGASIFFLTLPSGEINVSLSPPLQLTDAGFIPVSLPVGETVVEATGINCKVKQTTLVYGINNRQLLSLDSGGIQGSPFIRLAFLQGGTGQIEVVAYNINPKIFCSEGSGLPIEVAIKDMQLTVRGNFLGTSTVLDTQQVFGSRLLSFGQGQGEQTLISFPVQVSKLESQLPDQDFPISLIFEITGKINVNYRDFPSLIYQIPIFRADLETFHTIDIRKAPEVFIGIVTITCPSGQEDVDPSPDSILCKPIDTDKDGYPDITDSCPLQAEIFNGFEDLDGCPDTAPLITCSDGSMVTSTSLCPAPVITCESQDDRNCTRALCEADGGVFIEERNILNQVTGTYCQLDLVKPKCEPDEKLELTTGNIFICVPDPDLQDTDGDGILNGIDLCPLVFGVPEFQGCPEPPPPPPIGTLEELILSGDVLTFIEVIFTDGTTETTLGSLKSGSIDTSTFSQRFGTIIPLEVTGSITGVAGKPISEINYLVFFELPNPQGVFLTSSNLSHIVTIIESSVSKRNGNVIQLTGETTGSSIIVGNLEGWILGEGIVSASEISQIARPLIPEGQSRDADVTIGYDGRFTFNRDTDTQTFVISISEIKFFDFQITSEVIPKVPINCEKQGLLPVKNEFGVVIGCKKPDPNDPDILACNSNERTSFLCDGQFRADNCNGTTICIEPDDDGDGFSNFRDGCINDPEDGLQPNPTDGCPQDRPEDPPTPPCPVGQICKPPNSVVPPDDPVCSETNPDACIIPPEQFTLLLIVVAVILIVIGIAVAISRRRAKVFG